MRRQQPTPREFLAISSCFVTIRVQSASEYIVSAAKGSRPARERTLNTSVAVIKFMMMCRENA
jgi:hypothetical protein